LKKLELTEATDGQIRTFAREVLNLEDADALSIKQLRTKVEAAWHQSYILLADDVPANGASAQAVAEAGMNKAEIEARAGIGISASSSKEDPVVDLVIAETDKPDGKDPVYLNINGMALFVARRKPQAVPWRYFLNLKGAVQRIYSQDEKTMEISHQDVPRFPWSLLPGGRYPDEETRFAFAKKDAERSGQTLSIEFFRYQEKKAELEAAA
jgi:hypothetical protein